MESFQVADKLYEKIRVPLTFELSMKKAECLWPFTSHLTKDHLLYISNFFKIFSTFSTMTLCLGIRI